MRLPSLFVRFFRDFRRNQQGNVLVILGVSLGVIAGVGGLAIDMSYAYVLRGQLQRTADAAALAGVSQLPDETAARTEALQYADQNMASADHGTVLASSDVVAGNWDGGTRTFTPAGTPVNALRVIAKRSQDNGNAAPTFFARILGFDSVDIVTSAVSARLPVSQADGMPLAVRAPGFGDLSPDIPEKPGPSEPANGSEFEIGEEITLFYFGKGSGSPVHLVLDVEAAGCSCDIKNIFSGEEPPFSMQFGDQYTVVGHGTGGGGMGNGLAARLDLATDHPDRTIIVPVADLTANSRNASGDLTGDIEIVDFLAVHLDEIIEEDVPDPSDPGNTISVRRVEGTILQKRVKFATTGTPSGFVADLSVFFSGLVY